jgi:hypothetical protein
MLVLEDIVYEIQNKLDNAKKEYKDISKLDMNSYGAGLEMGIITSMQELLDFIKEEDVKISR